MARTLLHRCLVAGLLLCALVQLATGGRVGDDAALEQQQVSEAWQHVLHR